MKYLHPVSKYIFGITPSSLPMSVDLRPKCSPIAEQGLMNNCVGFALIGAMEYLENLQSETFVSLSPQFVYYNERLLEGVTGLDSGAYMSDGIDVVKTYGACELSLWPTDESNLYVKPNAAAYADGLKRKAINTSQVDQTQASVMTTLASGYPVIFGFLAYESFESKLVAETGMVPMPNTSVESVLGGHAMLIVGYDLSTQMFLVRNSWSAGWGIGGYCWMPFAYVLNLNMANSFYVIEGIEWPETPVPKEVERPSFLRVNT
jgi:C1A family cysteine protease